MRRLVVRLVAALCLVCMDLPAAPRDASALKRIDEAMALYFDQDSGGAEALLGAIVRACGDRCSPGVVARAWMYLGIVRAGSRGDGDAVREAFSNALTLDPAVELDAPIVGPETAAEWESLRAAMGRPEEKPTEDAERVEGGEKPPPAPCAEREICPPGLRCSCGSDQECSGSEVCKDGVCADPEGCTTDDECASVERCVAGRCAPSEAPSLRLGVHLVQDFVLMGADRACSRSSREDGTFACFDESTGKAYLGDPQAGGGGGIATGLAPGTSRLLASVELALSPSSSLGARGGVALRGRAPGEEFPPVHVEARATHGLGPLAAALRPFAFVSLGLAQIDASVPVLVRDCGSGLEGDPPGTTIEPSSAQYRACKDGAARVAAHRPLKLRAWRRLGHGFAALGAGAMWRLGRAAVVVDSAALVAFPSAGFALESSIGVVYEP